MTTIDPKLRAQREASVNAHIHAEAVEHSISATLATFRTPRYEVPAVGAIADGPAAVEGLLHQVLEAFPDFWVKQHASNFTEMLDPGFTNFAGFFNPHSVPWNADLDPRTMEILDEATGWPGNVAKEITLSALPSAPSYPLPSTCK